MAADGFADAISPEALTMLSPYQTEQINRFGHCARPVEHALDRSLHPAGATVTMASDGRRRV